MNESPVTQIRAATVLPAKRTQVSLPTADGLRLVGELALPADADPVATLICLHPLPTHGGMMDSHLLKKAAFRLPALASLAVLRFNTRGTSSEQGASEGQFGGGVDERFDVAAAISYAADAGLPARWLLGWSFGTELALKWGLDDPARDDPARGEPAGGEPAGGGPDDDEPAGGEPDDDEPAGGEPARGEPDDDEPAGRPAGGTGREIEGAILLSPPLHRTTDADLDRWAASGKQLTALIPELDDYLRPPEARQRFARVPRAEVIAVDGAKHLWVGEPYVRIVLNEIVRRLNPAALVPPAMTLPTHWDQS